MITTILSLIASSATHDEICAAARLRTDSDIDELTYLYDLLSHDEIPLITDFEPPIRALIAHFDDDALLERLAAILDAQDDDPADLPDDYEI